jgi:transposase
MEKEQKKSQRPNVVSMPLVNPHAAGIDVGDTEHVVAIPEGLSIGRVRKFGTMTCDLIAICEWLQQAGITTVALESTGVYWKPLFSLLNRNGLEVYLVNARLVKNVTGRKTDEDDATWLQKLHSCGLLKSAYLPDDEQEALRTLVRYRHCLVQDCSRFKNRMQKSLELMNIKFHTLFADITGKTSVAFIEAILLGERNPDAFLPLVDSRIRARTEDILKSLQGNWRNEHLFTLEQSYAMYKTYEEHLVQCDKAIEEQLRKYETEVNEGIISDGIPPDNELKPKVKKQKRKTAPKFDVRSYLEKIYGVDVLSIYGLSEMAGLEILAETGENLSKWESEKHFVSWLNLCPNNKISGGKVISSKLLKKHPNAASQAFRLAANTLQRSSHWLGDYFRRMKSRGGNKFAVVATANKLATIFYKMVTQKQSFKPMELTKYQEKYKNVKIAFYERKLNELKKAYA